VSAADAGRRDEQHPGYSDLTSLSDELHLGLYLHSDHANAR